MLWIPSRLSEWVFAKMAKHHVAGDLTETGNATTICSFAARSLFPESDSAVISSAGLSCQILSSDRNARRYHMKTSGGPNQWTKTSHVRPTGIAVISLEMGNIRQLTILSICLFFFRTKRDRICPIQADQSGSSIGPRLQAGPKVASLGVPSFSEVVLTLNLPSKWVNTNALLWALLRPIFTPRAAI